MTSYTLEVAIVGAGPAGAACANSLLLNRRVSGCVALIDKCKFPRDKPCGDGIGHGAVGLIRVLKLEKCLEAHLPINFLSVTGPSGVRAK